MFFLPFRLIALTQSRAIDLTFNTSNSVFDNDSRSNELTQDFIIQNNGKIIVGGYFFQLQSVIESLVKRLLKR